MVEKPQRISSDCYGTLINLEREPTVSRVNASHACQQRTQMPENLFDLTGCGSAQVTPVGSGGRCEPTTVSNLAFMPNAVIDRRYGPAGEDYAGNRLRSMHHLPGLPGLRGLAALPRTAMMKRGA